MIEENSVARDLYTDIMAADLTRQHIPVEVETVPNDGDIKIWVTMMREEFAGLKSVLFGQDGHGGFLPDIKAGLEKLSKGQDLLEDQISSMVNTQLRDKAELEAKVQSVRSDLNSVGEIARSARHELENHCEDMVRRKKTRWELIFGLGGIVGMVAGIIFGILK
jgi:hypothetical protein